MQILENLEFSKINYSNIQVLKHKQYTNINLNKVPHNVKLENTQRVNFSKSDTMSDMLL